MKLIKSIGPGDVDNVDEAFRQITQQYEVHLTFYRTEFDLSNTQFVLSNISSKNGKLVFRSDH